MEPDADSFVSKLVWRSRCLQWMEIMGRLATADRSAPAKSGLTCYLWEIRRFPMLEPHEEYMLAKRWREHGDLAAAHKLVKSQLRLVAKIATVIAATACQSLMSSRRAMLA